MLRPVLFHVRARDEVRGLSRLVRIELGSALMALQRGFNLGMPHSRPMPTIGAGVEELRLRDQSGQYRVFFLRKAAAGIFVLSAFQKKTQQTPQAEINVAKRRLKEMLDEYKEDVDGR